MVKDSPTNAEDIEDVGLIPGSRRSPGEETATHSSIIAWEIPWTEEPVGLKSIGSQSVRHDWAVEQSVAPIAVFPATPKLNALNTTRHGLTVSWGQGPGVV